MRRGRGGAGRALLLVLLAAVVAVCEVASPDYYALVGVRRGASAKELKKAYRKKSLQFHPDKNPDPDASRTFAEINVAYETLSDPKLRGVYDRRGEEGVKQHQKNEAQGGAGGGFGFFGRRRAPAERTTPDVVMDLPVSLRDVYLGRVVEVEVRGQRLCQACGGTGGATACARCGGTGRVTERREVGRGFVQQVQRACPSCGGKGRVFAGHACPACSGRGTATAGHTVEAYVERGVADGERIVFEGQANEQPGAITGDLVLVVRVVPHAVFERAGNDLRAEMRVSLRESLLGIDRTLEHLDGHAVRVARAGVTAHGHTLRVRGEGMPHHNAASTRGDLLVTVRVDFPDAITAEQRRLLEGALA